MQGWSWWLIYYPGKLERDGHIISKLHYHQPIDQQRHNKVLIPSNPESTKTNNMTYKYIIKFQKDFTNHHKPAVFCGYFERRFVLKLHPPILNPRSWDLRGRPERRRDRRGDVWRLWASRAWRASRRLEERGREDLRGLVWPFFRPGWKRNSRIFSFLVPQDSV